MVSWTEACSARFVGEAHAGVSHVNLCSVLADTYTTTAEPSWLNSSDTTGDTDAHVIEFSIVFSVEDVHKASLHLASTKVLSVLSQYLVWF